MLLRLFSLLMGFLFAATVAAQESKPNIVFILADDLGYTDLACYGSKYYETPHIDRMAEQGMRFTSHYTCGPNCQPTRAALISGQYGPRTGVYTVGSTDRFDTSSRPLIPVENVQQLGEEKITLAESLQKAGYTTALYGKWHLGKQPQEHGFDDVVMTMGKHFNFVTTPKREVKEGTYLADFLTDLAVDFIERNRQKPFFLCLHHFGVHSPREAKPELIEKFRLKRTAGGHSDPTYAAMIASVDESVGRVLAKLDELNLSKNTLVVFTSDNGGVGGFPEPIAGITSNHPLRAGKGSLYEGGIRVAYIARWPQTVPAKATCDTPICSVDLYPTLLELASATPPKDYPLDGESYARLLREGDKAKLKRDAIYWHFPGYLGARASWRTTPAGAIRSGDWKLLEFFENGRLELYNLHDDIGEKKNLAKEMPEKTKELHDKLVAWRKDVKAPIPERKP